MSVVIEAIIYHLWIHYYQSYYAIADNCALMKLGIFSFLGIYHQIHNKLSLAYVSLGMGLMPCGVIIFISNLYLSVYSDIALLK